MSSFFLPVVASLFILTGICAEFCEISLEDIATVECVNANLIDVPSSEIPTDVQSLDLSNNKLAELKRIDWKPFESLETLHLTGNEIEKIEPDAFVDLKKLTNLDLSNNKLSYISPHMFSGNSLLGILNLRDNPELDLTQNGPFLFSESLISLDISSCRLNTLKSQTFSKLTHLVYLNLRYNNLRIVDLETFKFLYDLNDLDLRNNKWDCDCKIVKVLNWVGNKRRKKGLRIEHSPVKCLDTGMYKKLWNAASLNKPCLMERNGVDSVTTKGKHKTQLFADMTDVNINGGEINNETPVHEISKKDISSDSTTKNPSTENNDMLTPDISVAVYKNGEHSELISETYNKNIEQGSSWLEELQSRKVDSILFFCGLPVMLGISVFIALVAVNHFTNWLDCISPNNNAAERNTNFSKKSLIPASNFKYLENVSVPT